MSLAYNVANIMPHRVIYLIYQIFAIAVQHVYSVVCVTEILHVILNDKIPSSPHDPILLNSSHAQTFRCQSMTVRCRELVIEDGGRMSKQCE